jgi:branched-chain amino acid transport system ATP-binding protein
MVPEGGIVALLGANGAGKTTTLKAISNLLRSERGEVTKGSIEFEGKRVDTIRQPMSWCGAAASR